MVASILSISSATVIWALASMFKCRIASAYIVTLKRALGASDHPPSARFNTACLN